jgi:hypothetical protein
MGGDKLWLVGCLGSKPRLAESQTGGMRLVRRLGEAAAPVEGGGGSAGRAPTLQNIPWHSPYN